MRNDLLGLPSAWLIKFYDLCADGAMQKTAIRLAASGSVAQFLPKSVQNRHFLACSHLGSDAAQSGIEPKPPRPSVPSPPRRLPPRRERRQLTQTKRCIGGAQLLGQGQGDAFHARA